MPFRHSVEQLLLIEDFITTTIFVELGAIGGVYVDIESLFGALVGSENLCTQTGLEDTQRFSMKCLNSCAGLFWSSVQSEHRV